MKKTVKGNFAPPKETHAERVGRIRNMLWEKVEYGLEHETGTALALIMKLAKEMVKDAPSPASTKVSVVFKPVGESDEEAASA